MLNRGQGTLTVTDNDTGQTVTAVAFTGGNTYERPWYQDVTHIWDEQAAPDGVWVITENVNPNPAHSDWFSLLQKKPRLDDTFFDRGRRRNGARLHLGGQSYGCVTVDKNSPGQSGKWGQIVDMLGSTKRGSVDYYPSYYYYNNSTTTITSYGTLTIK